MKPANRKVIRLWYTDFWSNFDKENNFFTQILRKDFDVMITDNQPDILIYSWEGRDFLNFDCIRIYYTPENWLMPKYKECDFSLSFEYWDDPRNLRVPNYLLYGIHPSQLDKSKVDIDRIIESHTKFCSMVVSNPNTPERNEFFRKLSKYKTVDSGGKHLNNVGGRVADKYAFISQYKFNLCFENAQHPGYTSEKLVEAMKCMTLPLYWGNPLIHFEFNTQSFFNHADYLNDEDMIEDIIRHDQDPDLYYQKFIRPWFEDDIPNQFFDNQRIRKFLNNIIANKDNYTPIARNKFKRYFYYPVGYQVNMLLPKIRKLIK
ncbi:MAG: glycosyltransferase family 10 [Chitinophagaceae bacterium]|nr:glycosyltransferase family 10 [Chitinophagaceae bacterium]